ncbi:MAG: 30S ribosomal protein S16 [Candidatus Paceibacterota bacterium]|jgi:small subunit ribosomal protein S16
MLKIRFQRIGRKNDPSFRAVLTDSKNSTKSGRFLEILGTYNPRAKDGTKRTLNTDRIKYWIGQGAKPSDTMHNFLIHDKVLTGKKVNVLPKKKPTSKRKELKAAK